MPKPLQDPFKSLDPKDLSQAEMLRILLRTETSRNLGLPVPGEAILTSAIRLCYHAVGDEGWRTLARWHLKGPGRDLAYLERELPKDWKTYAPGRRRRLLREDLPFTVLENLETGAASWSAALRPFLQGILLREPLPTSPPQLAAFLNYLQGLWKLRRLAQPTLEARVRSFPWDAGTLVDLAQWAGESPQRMARQHAVKLLHEILEESRAWLPQFEAWTYVETRRDPALGVLDVVAHAASLLSQKLRALSSDRREETLGPPSNLPGRLELLALAARLKAGRLRNRQLDKPMNLDGLKAFQSLLELDSPLTVEPWIHALLLMAENPKAWGHGLGDVLGLEDVHLERLTGAPLAWTAVLCGCAGALGHLVDGTLDPGDDLYHPGVPHALLQAGKALHEMAKHHHFGTGNGSYTNDLYANALAARVKLYTLGLRWSVHLAEYDLPKAMTRFRGLELSLELVSALAGHLHRHRKDPAGIAPVLRTLAAWALSTRSDLQDPAHKARFQQIEDQLALAGLTPAEGPLEEATLREGIIQPLMCQALVPRAKNLPNLHWVWSKEGFQGAIPKSLTLVEQVLELALGKTNYHGLRVRANHLAALVVSRAQDLPATFEAMYPKRDLANGPLVAMGLLGEGAWRALGGDVPDTLADMDLWLARNSGWLPLASTPRPEDPSRRP